MQNMYVLSAILFCLGFLTSTLPLSAQESAAAALAVPAGAVLQIRVKQTLSSYSTPQGTAVTAEVIAPVEVNGRTLLPMRTLIRGHVREVRRVGLGFSRETALLHLDFDRIELPGGQEQRLTGRVTRLDDARERVDPIGRIQGIRATDTFASALSGAAIAVSAFDPMALLFALSSSLSIFRLPDSSIIVPAGSELHFEVGASIPVAGEAPPQYPSLQTNEAFYQTVQSLPYRTATEGDGSPSDLTSLLYVGSREAIASAFRAAGWVRADELDSQSTYGVMRSIIENQGYRAAPMSVLLLDGKKPVLTYAKTLNTFFSRHHLRIYGHDATDDGRQIWSSTATYDSGVGFSRTARTFIHIINENIDEERSKVVNDLVLTGCVEGVSYLPRPWVPRDAKNATGDYLRTDGRIAVLRLNDCTSPQRADASDDNKVVRTRQSAALRPLRAMFLTFRNDFTRGNMIYQAYAGTRLGLQVLRSQRSISAESGSIRYGGEEFQIVRGASRQTSIRSLPKDPGHTVHSELQKRRPVSYASRLMFSLNSGLAGYGNTLFSTLPTTIVIPRPGGDALFRDPLNLGTQLERGWTLSPKVTLNSWRYVSNEFSYLRTVTNLRIFGKESFLGETVEDQTKALIRSFTYNALIHGRPNGKRFRPYIAAGPSLHVIHLQESKPGSSSLLRFAVRDLALLLSAYDFGSKPPLEGGGVFQIGFNYGAGAHVHLSRRVFLRADFRETLTAQPNFWKSSAEKLSQSITPPGRLEISPLVMHGPLRYQIVTAGLGVSF